jgi:hypothetical protein
LPPVVSSVRTTSHTKTKGTSDNSPFMADKATESGSKALRLPM